MTVCEKCLARSAPTGVGGSGDGQGATILRKGTAICRHDPSYPPALAQLAGAPAILCATCRGRRLGELLATPTVALVGEPFYSDYAHRVAYRLAAELAEAGTTVTAVLREGIDSIALDGALCAHGPTLAIRPTATTPGAPRHSGRPGLDRLHARVAATGAVVWGAPPSARGPGPTSSRHVGAALGRPMHADPGRARRASLIEARRLLAAIARVVVVVEARKRSIALFTAELAADLGHDVAVIPGRVTDQGGHGTFELLRDGAHPVRDAGDVLELIGRSRLHAMRSPATHSAAWTSRNEPSSAEPSRRHGPQRALRDSNSRPSVT
ncbi:MAG TPA: DNA-processing protein DprA [Solirubrobacteraceae bacterium]|nr:DNA-processing protein DprA [Solirubrobacteraceae bacterium]